jgi:glyoxylate reductase
VKPKVLITLKVPHSHLAPLDGVAEVIMPDYEPGVMPYAEVKEKITGCTAVICQGELRIDSELLDAAPQLKIAANISMGIDNLDLDALTRRGIMATNTPDAFVESTADFTLALILSVSRHLVRGDAYVRSGSWEKDGFQPTRWEGMLLRGKTLGLVGYGQIAKAVEKRASSFGLQVIHTRSAPSTDPRYRSLEALLGESDIVALHVPHTADTHHLINRQSLAQMKAGSVLINVARGKVVDEQALVEALKSGHLGGAGLDVFENEPAVTSELCNLPKVVLAPHIGGSTLDDRRRGRLLAAENVALFLSGQAPLTPLNTVS